MLKNIGLIVLGGVITFLGFTFFSKDSKENNRLLKVYATLNANGKRIIFDSQSMITEFKFKQEKFIQKKFQV